MTKNPFRRGWSIPGFAFLLLGGMVAAGCHRHTPPATDSKSLQKHAEELKKQYERERNNK